MTEIEPPIPLTQFDIQKLRRLQSYVAAGDAYLVRSSLASDVPANELFFLQDMPQTVQHWFDAYFPTNNPSSPQPTQTYRINHQASDWFTDIAPTTPDSIIYRQSGFTQTAAKTPDYSGPGHAIRELGSGGYARVLAVDYQHQIHAVKMSLSPQHPYLLAHEYFQITTISQANPNLGDFVPQISLPEAEAIDQLKAGRLFTTLRPGVNLESICANPVTFPQFRPGTKFPTSRRHHLAITTVEKYQQLHQSGHTHGDIKLGNLLVNLNPATNYTNSVHSVDYANSHPINPERELADTLALRRLVTQILFGSHPRLEIPNPTSEDIFAAITSHRIAINSPLADLAEATKISHILGYLNRSLFY